MTKNKDLNLFGAYNENMASASPSKYWSAEEKLALCMAIIRQHNYSVNWQTLELPAGRTRGASQFCWHNLKKDAEKVHMAKGDEIPDSTPIKTPRKPRVTKKRKLESASPAPEAEGDHGGEQDNNEEPIDTPIKREGRASKRARAFKTETRIKQDGDSDY